MELPHTSSYTSNHKTYDPAMMVCYRECLSNLEKFNDNEERKILQFINSLERIGKMINANDNILHCMCTAKLDGEAKRWYENNTSLTEWTSLKSALLERFTQSDSSSRAFEQLKERKQKSDETITSYYDDIIKLCRDYDPSMSHRMKVSWLENGIKDSLKIPIKRQMKLLAEEERTIQAFLKIAKDEQELQHNSSPDTETTSAHIPYFTNAVSTTQPPAENSTSRSTTTAKYHWDRSNQRSRLQRSPTYQPTTANRSYEPHRHRPQHTNSSYGSRRNTRKFTPCIICQRENHRTIDCHQKQSNGCYKCGQSDHRIRDCPEVFC